MTQQVISFHYMNYKGESRERTVRVTSLDFLSNPGYGYQPGWFLTGVDIVKNEVRSFALCNIIPQKALSTALLMRLPL